MNRNNLDLDIIESPVYSEQLNLLENEIRRRAGHVLVTYKDKLYLWGGYMEEPHQGTYDRVNESNTSYHKVENIWIYEPLVDIWYRKSCKGSIPKQVSGPFFANVGSFLYIFGGYFYDPLDLNYEGLHNALWRLDLETLKWDCPTQTGDKPFPADKGTSWAYKDRFYVFGGFGQKMINNEYSNAFPYNKVSFVTEREHELESRGWFDQLCYFDIGESCWVWPTTVGFGPSARAAHAVTVIKNKAYLFGGRHKERRLQDLYVFDLDHHLWQQIEVEGTIPQGRSWHSFTAISDHQIILYGGFSTTSQVLNDVWMLDTNTYQWKQQYPKVPLVPRLWHCSVFTDTKEYIAVGGISQNILDNSIAKDHAEDMLIIRFSPPTLFRRSLEYLSRRENSKLFRKYWKDLSPILKQLLENRTDPFELHGVKDHVNLRPPSIV